MEIRQILAIESLTASDVLPSVQIQRNPNHSFAAFICNTFKKCPNDSSLGVWLLLKTNNANFFKYTAFERRLLVVSSVEIPFIKKFLNRFLGRQISKNKNKLGFPNFFHPPLLKRKIKNLKKIWLCHFVSLWCSNFMPKIRKNSVVPEIL